jgi:FkbM family methyltransferase
MVTLARRAIARIVFLLPPLKRLRQHNLRLERRVARLRSALRIAASRQEVSRERNRLKREAARERLTRVEANLAARTAELLGRGRTEYHLRAKTARTTRPSPEREARERSWRAAHPAYDSEAARKAAGQKPSHTIPVEIAGVTWRLPNDAATHGSLSRRITDRGWLPFDDIFRVRRLVVGGGMLDIGANIGTTAIPRALLHDFSVIYAAEPDPDNYACLVANVLAHGLGGAILPDQLALSSSTGMLRLRRSTHMGTHHLLPAEGKTHLPSIDVHGSTVDDWIIGLRVAPGDLTFVKVDAQGWDAHVMLGAQSLLAARHVVWQVEFSPAMMDRTGVGVREFTELVTEHFSHFRMMEKDERERPASEIAEVGAALGSGGGYANLLLYSKA